jgi:hypothetical protein
LSRSTVFAQVIPEWQLTNTVWDSAANPDDPAGHVPELEKLADLFTEVPPRADPWTLRILTTVGRFVAPECLSFYASDA